MIWYEYSHFPEFNTGHVSFQLSEYVKNGEQRKINISFVNKRNARLSSRLTRNQSRKRNEPEFVDLDQVNDPTSSTAQAMLDLKDQPPESFSVPFWKVISEINDESSNDCEDVYAYSFSNIIISYFCYCFLILLF